ncbi:MAG: TolC family protein [Bacteroidota bacterium]
MLSIVRILLALSVGAVGLLLGAPAQAQDTLRPIARVALLSDGPGVQGDSLSSLVAEELRVLAAREFDLRFQTAAADHTLPGAAQLVDRVMADPAIDLVITLGVLTSQVAAQRREPPHPVIAAAVFDPRLQGLPLDEGTSGVSGISYLVAPDLLARELVVFREIAAVDTVAVLVGAGLLQALPGIEQRLAALEAEVGLTLVPVGLGASPEDALDSVPASVDGVYVGPLSTASPQSIGLLAAALIERGLPSFSFGGRGGVERGLLASLSADRAARLARRVAVDAERVLLGDEPGAFSVHMTAGERLVLNLATARQIGVTPPLGLVLEATLVGAPMRDPGVPLSLDEAMRGAVEGNLALAAQQRAVEAGAAQVREARSTLLPQLEAGATGSLVDADLAEASLGQQPEWSAQGKLTLTQVLFSEDARANVGIQRASQEARTHEFAALELDIALDAAEAYLGVLRALALVEVQQANLVLTRESLELADRREAIGAAGPAEALRLRAELATRRTDLIDAFVQVQAAEIALNQVLNRPLETPVAVATTVSEDRLADTDPLAAYIVDAEAFTRLRDVLSAEAIRAEPGIQALEAGIRAQKRAGRAARRAFYLPTVALVGQASTSLYEGGAGTEGLAFPTDPMQPMAASFPEVPGTFWTLGLNVTLPLFEGGGRTARLARATAEVHRLQLERDLIAQRVEQNVRTQLHVTAASYAAIQEARRAADAARQSLDIVTRSYAAGALDVTALLESQAAAQRSEVGVTNAVYDFLVNVKRVERAIGRFEALAPAEEQEAFRRRLDAALQSTSSTP